MTNPKLLILDEATEGLAPMIAKEIWNILFRLKEQGLSSIIIDRNYHQLLEFSDRAIIIEKGQVMLDFPTKDRPKFQDQIIRLLGV